MNVLAPTMSDFKALVAPAAPADPGTQAYVTAIYDSHQRELFTFALRGCRDREAAEDLVHEAFVRLVVEVDAGRTPRSIRAWLYRVVANLAVSRGRRATVAERQLGALLAGQTDAGPEPAISSTNAMPTSMRSSASSGRTPEPLC
jgi:DNA-directed RNA polymerase specialized sigma24 family protein